ncbi:MAG: hypothetical protein ACW981_04320 [Candidatus Hodarchaeales archaeon]|jgi:hypothetical protein
MKLKITENFTLILILIFFFLAPITSTTGHVSEDLRDADMPPLNEIWGNPPRINEANDISYLEKTTNNLILWFPKDLFPDTYTVYIDDEVTDSQVWVSNNRITVNVDNLIVGEHNVTIILKDQEGNQVKDTVIVTVLEIINTNSSQTTTSTTLSFDFIFFSLVFIIFLRYFRKSYNNNR